MTDTNCNGLIRCTDALLPGMIARGRGHIVNLGSVAGTYPYPGGNVYGATKAFVQCPVAASVESVACGLAAGGLDRAGPGELGERGVVATAAGVGERHDGLGGADWADPVLVGQPGG
jgi:NAD(P)-dependent dehydrogenase (short-subunit alcohol dehydrogenase family)